MQDKINTQEAKLSLG